MSSKTEKLKLNVWSSSDYVNFEEINDNFNKLDSCAICYESGVKTATYSGGSDAAASWHYKKFTDGTVEASAALHFTNLKCNAEEHNGLYYSATVNVNFPFEFSSIYDVQMHLASNSRGWVSNITGATVLNSVSFILFNTWSESDTLYKQVFISIKGTI